MTTWTLTHQPTGTIETAAADDAAAALADLAAAAGRTIAEAPAPGRLALAIDGRQLAALSIGTDPTAELAALADTIAQLAHDQTETDPNR